MDSDDFDYYSDVKMIIIIRDKEYIIFKDNLLFLKNIIKNYNVKKEYIDTLDEEELGILLNLYYKMLYDDLTNNKIDFNESGEWIGEQYVIFTSKICATWLYMMQGKYIVKVTPIFDSDNEYEGEYLNFISHYQDILRVELSEDELNIIASQLEDIISLYL